MQKYFNLGLLILLLYLFTEIGTSVNTTKYISYKRYKQNYQWLTKSIYIYVRDESKKYDISISLIFAIIDVESQGRNIISKKNKNGSKDYGLMQVNSVHEKYPRKLLNIKYNIKKGISYLNDCFNMSQKRYGHVHITTIIRLYNQGFNGKVKYYKNWKYVDKIYNNWRKI